jgi:putative oxygen-independent coproporphyrinogen III oxidase
LADDPGFGLYVHWPWCQSKCPYCDFNSHVAEKINETRWTRAYLTDLDRWADITGPRVLRSIFFGGGTPSLMSAGLIGAIIRRAGELWSPSNSIEITVEANPSSVEADRFRAYRDQGVNRVSLGLQALDDTDLQRLGRLHRVADSLRALDIAQATFDRVSADLIYARQYQSLTRWKAELEQALSFGLDHLSLYQLTIEDGTVFGARHQAGKLPGLPDEDLGADLWELTQDMTTAAGLPAYEVSNHARPGAESRHNRIYWQSGDWVGCGPGAHGRITTAQGRRSYEAARAPTGWLTGVESGTTDQGSPLSRDDQLSELLLMGLRLWEGVDESRIAAVQDEDLSNRINYLIEEGFLARNAGRLLATASGRPVLNAVLRRLSGA